MPVFTLNITHGVKLLNYEKEQAYILMSGSITISARAAKKISQIIAKEETSKVLRISVSGGGCSGFQYGFDLEAAEKDDDLVFEKDGIKVIIDTVSIMYMDGSEVDYVDNLIGASFQINNPNATASCGCGTSFSL